MTTNGQPDTIVLDLLDAQKPVTVRNFLSYVRSGSYNNTIIHRAASLTADPLPRAGRDPPGRRLAAPASLTAGQNLPHIPTSTRSSTKGRRTASLQHRRDDRHGPDERPNSETSEWFINSTSNTELDPSTGNAGYVVFGTIDPASGSAVSDLANLKRYNFGASTPFPTLPLQNAYQGSQTAPTTPATAADLVTITGATVAPKFTFSAASSDPSVLAAAVNASGQLTLTPSSQTRGTAVVTVTATEVSNPQSVSTQTVAVSTAAGTQVVLSSKGDRSVTFTPTGGKKSTFVYKGTGTATLTLSGTNSVADASPKNHKVIAAGSVTRQHRPDRKQRQDHAHRDRDRFTVNSLTSDGPIGSLSGPIDLNGTVSVNGAVSSWPSGHTRQRRRGLRQRPHRIRRRSATRPSPRPAARSTPSKPAALPAAKCRLDPGQH